VGKRGRKKEERVGTDRAPAAYLLLESGLTTCIRRMPVQSASSAFFRKLPRIMCSSRSEHRTIASTLGTAMRRRTARPDE